MKNKENNNTDYWFVIESYVFVSIANNRGLVYNTLDGVAIETDNINAITLLEEVLQESNYGVVLLKYDRYIKEDIYSFIKQLRKHFMADIIDVRLSKSKPIQLLPYIGCRNNINVYRKHLLSSEKSIMTNLLEVNIVIDHLIDIKSLIDFLKSFPEIKRYNLIIEAIDVLNSNDLLSLINSLSSEICIICSCDDLSLLNINKNISLYKIIFNHPFNIKYLKFFIGKTKNAKKCFKFVFNVKSEGEYIDAEQIVNKYSINNYEYKPTYTNKNISFFEEYIYLNRGDILSSNLSMKDLLIHQSLNTGDFGKITIMSNGDIYANINNSVLGNIDTSNMYDIVLKEISEGLSWFNIRNQEPCNECIYQWLCPSPSDYEKMIGKCNLCHIIHKDN